MQNERFEERVPPKPPSADCSPAGIAAGSNPCAAAGTDCGVCGLQPAVPGNTESPNLLTGWRFAAASLGAFASPLILALAGSMCFRGNQPQQLIAAVAGLCLGMTIAACVARLGPASRTEEVKQ